MEHKIAIRIPTMGSIRTELLGRLQEYQHDRRIDVQPISGISDHAAARNQLVMYHYDYAAYTHLCLIDSDTVPPMGFIDRMLAVDRPVVSGVCHIFQHREPNKSRGAYVRWALWVKRLQEDQTVTYDKVWKIPSRAVFERPGLVTGCFCMLIRSEVLEKLSHQMPWFKTTYLEQTQEKMESEDLYFCRRVEEELGIRITILTDLVCDHWKTVNLAHVAQMENCSSNQWEVGVE